MTTRIEAKRVFIVLIAVVAVLLIRGNNLAFAEDNSPQHRMTEAVEWCDESGGESDYVQIEGYTMSKCVYDDDRGTIICDHTGAEDECSYHENYRLVGTGASSAVISASTTTATEEGENRSGGGSIVKRDSDH